MDDALRKLLQSIQEQVVSSQRQLGIVRAQIQQRDRDKRLLELTRREVVDANANEPDVGLWKGVGKIFLHTDMLTLKADLEDKLKEAEEDISNLGKKQKFLEARFQESQGHLRDVLNRPQ